LNLATSDEQELIFSFRKKLEIEILKANPLFSGVEEFLQSARDLGHPIAIATSKPTYLAKLVVMNSPLSKFIDYVQGTDDFPAKPAPDVILKCLSFFNKSQGVMFGDRIEDMLAASSAGIPSIGIAQGFHSISDLVSAGAEIAFDDFFELQKNLQDWSSSPQFHSHLKLPDSFT
jgi:phosphoglycolate phosphatase